MSYQRTPEHRAMRAEMIKRWKPWEKSTGPKTYEGKKRSAKRGYKGEIRGLLRQLGKISKKQEDIVNEVNIQIIGSRIER